MPSSATALALAGDGILVLGATMRLTRLVVTDDLGVWVLKWPARRWAARADPHSTGWQTKAVSGLDCPFCVGTWVGYGVLASYCLARRSPWLGGCWRFVAAGLALNEVAAHLGARLGDTATD
jgi:hypothetical protein